VIEAANQGNDTVVSASINLDLANYANVEHAALTGSSGLSLTGDSNANTLTGNSGNNTLDGGLGNDLLIGGGGDDTLIGGDGDDTYVVDSSTDILIENAAAGTDTVQSADISLDLSLYSNIEHASLLGSSDLNLTGDSNDNVLIGNSGNNTLDGGAGNDTMIGGDGNDTYIVDSSGDVITELPNQGSDTVQSDVISLDLGSYSNVEHATLTGSANLNLTGDTNANILIGNSGNNTLDGGVGDDILLGGEGDDTYIVDSSSDVITELANQGLDTVQSATIDLDLGNYAHVEQGQLLGNFDLDLTGNSDNNSLLGNSGANTLIGLAGNDSLDGGTGTDVLIGGEGDDVYTVDDLTDSIVELADQGSDTVQSADLSLDLLNYANVESALLLGSANLNLTGSAADNTLTGNSGNNTLDGGAGNDTLIGGDGDDLYIIDSTNDIVIEGQNGGTDTIQSETVSIDLLQYANVEHATLTGSSNLNITGSHDAANILTGNAGNNMIIGNALNDTLIGNDGDDTLDGSGGKDIMIGGLGNDTYYVSTLGDQVTELSNQGTDTVIVGFSYTLGAHVENLSLTGNGDLKGTGNVHNNTLLGTSGNNILLGGGGVDQLYGGLGDDLLNGGTNVDSLYGGDGNDTYYVNLTGDQVFEQFNEGIDTVNSLVDYTLGNHVENLILGGTDHLKANGNALDNQIIGNSGNNLINGGLGDNLLIGGAGNDQYRLNRDFGTNTVLENAAEGTDTVQFGLGVLREQVWLSRVDDDLVVQIIGTNANVVVQDWYSAGANIEQFRLLSGRTLMAADVDTLVNAMASLTPPAFGETTLSAATKNALGTVFADTWNTIT
jgi:Ca2+-binding RTX toxin-like protein